MMIRLTGCLLFDEGARVVGRSNDGRGAEKPFQKRKEGGPGLLRPRTLSRHEGRTARASPDTHKRTKKKHKSNKEVGGSRSSGRRGVESRENSTPFSGENSTP